MFPGSMGKACFGPTEIDAMRRALTLAERALPTSCQERRQEIARSIVQFAASGQFDPLVLSAMAVQSRRQKEQATFHPYHRRAQAGRPHARLLLHVRGRHGG